VLFRQQAQTSLGAKDLVLEVTDAAIDKTLKTVGGGLQALLKAEAPDAQGFSFGNIKAQSAIDAVKQWQYTPTLLNGVPVPVIMTVTVNFRLN